MTKKELNELLRTANRQMDLKSRSYHRHEDKVKASEKIDNYPCYKFICVPLFFNTD